MESVSASSIKYKSSEGDIDAVVSDNQPAVSENTELNMENRSISENDPDSGVVKILFVGNSFTRYRKGGENCSVPKQLKELAKITGKKIKADCVTNGGAKLLYYTGSVAKYKAYYQQLVTKLLEENWDYVVLQDQSVMPAFSADTEMASAIASLQKMTGKLCPRAKLLLYMTHAYEFAGMRNMRRCIQENCSRGLVRPICISEVSTELMWFRSVCSFRGQAYSIQISNF